MQFDGDRFYVVKVKKYVGSAEFSSDFGYYCAACRLEPGFFGFTGFWEYQIRLQF